jgi:hypothetical protein
MLNFRIDKDKLESVLESFIDDTIDKLRFEKWEVDDIDCRQEIEEEIIDQMKDHINQYLGKQN